MYFSVTLPVTLWVFILGPADSIHFPHSATKWAVTIIAGIIPAVTIVFPVTGVNVASLERLAIIVDIASISSNRYNTCYNWLISCNVR